MKRAISALIVVLLAAGIIYAASPPLTNEVDVGQTCGLSLDSATVDFTTMSPGDTSTMDANYVVITNDGNTATDVSINGTAWTSTGSSFVVGKTHWANDTGSNYATKAVMTGSPEVAQYALAGGSYFSLYLDLNIPNPQDAGAYTQTVDITSSC
jgi:hypothetical protein